MRCGLRGFVVLILVVGISSCSGEYEPRPSGADDAGVGGTKPAVGGSTAIDGTSSGAAGAVAGVSQVLGGSNSTTSAGSSAGASTTAGASGSAMVAVGGSQPGGGSGANGVGGWPADAGARPILSDCRLPIPPGPGGIAKPAGTAGNLRVLNWAGFKAAATYTFDDANSSQIANYAALNTLGVPLTFFLWTSRSTAADPIWARAVLDGHELANHTQSHTTTGTAVDVDAATTFIEQHFGVKVWTMASPYGNSSYVPLAQPRFLANRGVASGWISANGSNDPFQLPCYLPPQGALASAMNSVLDSSRSAGAWQIVLVHGFTGGTDGAYQPVAISEFTSSVYHTKAWGDVWIGSMVEVAAYWRAQKMFSAAASTTSGTDRTWTWTLPAHFPPGKCLRVNADGGSLKQGGETLAWNDHGYYEIALDQGSLTLSSATDTTNAGGSGGGGAGTGGSSAAGGSNAGTGGTLSAGGSNAETGGTLSAGGSSAETGGTLSAGGSSAETGGTLSASGSNAGTGGTLSAGGSNAETGGTLSEGGSNAGTGGTLSAGGSNAETGGTLSASGSNAGTGGTLSEGGSNAGTGGTLSEGGSNAGTGGTLSEGGSNAATGGAPSAGAGGASDISATGVIEMSVPLAEDGQDQGYDIFHLFPPLDLSGATVTARVYAPAAVNGQFAFWFSCPVGGASAAVITEFAELNAGYFEIEATVPAADGTFDPSQIDGVHFEVQSTTSGPWQYPATNVYLDSIVSSNGGLNDTFDTSPDNSLFSQSIWQTVSDSSFTWLANYP